MGPEWVFLPKGRGSGWGALYSYGWHICYSAVQRRQLAGGAQGIMPSAMSRSQDTHCEPSLGRGLVKLRDRKWNGGCQAGGGAQGYCLVGQLPLPRDDGGDSCTTV